MTLKPADWPGRLRAQDCYGGTSSDTIYHRGWLKNQGHRHDLFDGRPVIGILNTWSDLPSAVVTGGPVVKPLGEADKLRKDARMSGTAYGTVVLHTSPEAARGGPLAIVRDGDMIEIDVAARRIHLDIPDAEIAARLSCWTYPEDPPASGHDPLDHVEGADTGADFDILKGCRGAAVPKESH